MKSFHLSERGDGGGLSRGGSVRARAQVTEVTMVTQKREGAGKETGNHATHHRAQALNRPYTA